MKPAPTTLPLGIDIGRRRIRVALVGCEPPGSPKLRAVATRDHGGYPAAALRSAIDELQTDERRCVFGLAPPDALLVSADFPAMPARDRIRAARFEATRFIDYPVADATLSLVPSASPQRWTMGIARRTALAALHAAAKHARLRTLAVDDVAFALRRAYPTAAAAIDVGANETRLTTFGMPIPNTLRLPIGGSQFTDAIALSLGIDVAAAEERKRRIGFAGAGEAQRDALSAALTEALDAARSDGAPNAGPIELTGNGSRIPGFGEALERALGREVRHGALPADCSDTLPADVVRVAGADWSVAYGLSLWSTAP